MVDPFAPCSLAELAQHMRDGTWLDLRTSEGRIQRVRIVKIIVHLRRDDVELRQDWIGEDDCRQRHSIVLEADAIWRAAPTTTDIFDVKPWGHPAEQPEVEPVQVASLCFDRLDEEEPIVRLICQKAEEHWNAQLADNRWLHVRYVTMLVMYEMTNLSPTQLTGVFGYASPTPLFTARDHIKWEQRTKPPPHVHVFVNQKNVRKLGNLVGQPQRSARLYPSFYSPVLK